MIEIREIRTMGKSDGKLQYRYFVPSADASGALSAHGGVWSKWRDVPFVYTGSDEAAQEPHRFGEDLE